MRIRPSTSLDAPHEHHLGRRFSLATIILIATLIALVIGADLYLRSLGPKAKKRVVHALSERFNAQVELAELHLSLLPRPQVSGDRLTIQRDGDYPDRPFISIRRFSAHSGIFDLLFQRDKVDTVRLEGLVIHLAPRGRSALKKGFEGEKQREDKVAPKKKKSRPQFGIQTIIADGTLLQIEPKDPSKDPLRFDIRSLTLHSVSLREAMTFETVLTNPKPPGLIHSHGEFGPWDSGDPRLTPVSGDYTFQDADLGVFKGIRGILASDGRYGGTLERIAVDGKTDVPDFALSRGGAPVHLATKFHAVVDGTDGETVLDPVDATFLNSEFICRGGVVKRNAESGKTVDLDAVTTHARMEDILTLVLGDQTPMITGDMKFKSNILIPPGHEEVLKKLKLAGDFALKSAIFTSPKVSSRLRTLSNRARGISKNEEGQGQQKTVASNLTGAFKLASGTTSFSRLSFSVPGAQILLHGTYDLRSQKIDMDGKFRMEATLADTQSGLKKALLKPLDPFFAKHGAGFEVPISIGGTREHPDIGALIFHHRFTVK
jgi:hypothetical protein